MQPSDILDQLRRLTPGFDYVLQCDALIQEWVAAGVGAEAVAPILTFWETSPNSEAEDPFPLIHFVEQFNGSDYEAKLEASIHRKPVPITALLLNRLINGARSPDKRMHYIALMQAAIVNPSADKSAQREFESYLKYQTEK